MKDALGLYLEDFGIYKERAEGLLRWVCRKTDSPEEAVRFLREHLGHRNRRKEWEDDIYYDTISKNHALLEALQALWAE